MNRYEKLNGYDNPEVTIDTPSKYEVDNQNNENYRGLTIHIEEDADTTLKGCCSWFRQRYFTKDKLYRRLPILKWLPEYSLMDLKGDIIAGISVAFTIVPQGLAFALLAGLDPQYGLYTSFMGCFIYAILGSCKDVAIGPTSIMAIMTFPYVEMGGVPYAILLAFLSGCVQLLFGILNLGFIVDFISFPVVSSFSSAAAITIASTQLKGFFGLKYSASRFPNIIAKFFANLWQIHLWDTILGIVCLLFLIPAHIAKDFRFKTTEKNNRYIKVLNAVWYLIVTARFAVLVIVCVLIVALNSGNTVFTLTRKVRTGLPPFEMVPFTIVSNNTTIYFNEIFTDLSTGIFVIALLGLLESVAVAKAFNSSKKLDATQEMIAIGLSNIMGSFFGAFPGTGAFSRSAVNHNSGVRTPLGGVITGGLVLAALAALGPYFQFIPQTVLASIIIAAVVFMIHPSDALIIWHTNKVDILPYITTFLSSLLLGLEYGVVVGVCTSVMILLYQMARPKIFVVTRSTPDGFPFLYVKPDRSVFFPSIEYMKVKIGKELPDNRELTSRISVVIDGEHMFRADSTFALGLKDMIISLSKEGVMTIFYNLRKSVYKALKIAFSDNDFHHCKTENDVYSMIKSHNKIRRSQSLAEALMNHSTKSRHNWASQSGEAY